MKYDIWLKQEDQQLEWSVPLLVELYCI